MHPARLSIIGVGLLGGSIGLAAKSASTACRIVGYGHRAETIRRALEVGAIDESADSVEQAVRGADLVILCTPVGLFERILRQIALIIAQNAAQNTIVTDVGSTKRSVVRLAESILPHSAHFVGSHPMAGSEKRGVEFARADLFQGAACILTPTAGTDPEVVEKVSQFWKTLGMTTTRLSPEDHDRLICDVSHLPHAVAAALVAMQSDDALALAGKGFLDATRIAGGDGGIWRDILLDNRDNIANSLNQLRDRLDHLLKILDANQGDELRRWLDSAAAKRLALHAAKIRELLSE